MNFMCSCCKQRVAKNKPAEFLNKVGLHTTAYHMDWVVFEKADAALPFTERRWVNLDDPPSEGEMYTMKVRHPFDEEICGIFTAIFEPAMMFINGWDCAEHPEDIGKAAAVLCQFTEVLWADEYSAFIKVRVRNVVPLADLCRVLPVKESDTPVERFGECSEVWTEYEDEHWLSRNWNGQGDVGEQQYLYRDDEGKVHEVMTSWFDFHDDTYYLHNNVNKPGVGRSDGNLKKHLRLISNNVRFGVGYLDCLHKERQYFAFHGQPVRNDDFFTTAEISVHDYFRIEKDYPEGAVFTPEQAEEFRKKYIDGRKVIMEGMNKLP